MADNKISEETARSAFEEFDADNSGFLDADEFFALAGNLGQVLDKAECQAALGVIDESKDGKIQFDEFYKWLSTAPEAGKKGKKKMAKLRAALLTRNAIRFVRTLSSAPVDDAAKVTATLGDKASCDKVSISAYLSKSHVVDKKCIENMPEKGGIIISIDLKHKGGEGFKKWVTSLAENFVRLDNTVRHCFFVTHPSADVARVNIMPWGRDARKMTELLSVVEEKLGSSGVKVDLGFTAATIAAEGFCIKDAMNAIAVFKGVIPPEVPMMMGQAKDQLPIPADQIPGLEDLIAGKQEIEGDFTALLTMLLGQGMQNAPEEIQDGNVRNIVKFAVSKMSQRNKKEMTRALTAFKMFMLVLQKEIVEVQAAHIRTKDGYGPSVELTGLQVEECCAAATSFVNLAIDEAKR